MHKVATATATATAASWVGGCKIGTGEDFVVAIGSSSCGDISEGVFGKKVGIWEVKGSHWRTAYIKDR
jgi:hypothetical protein